MARHKAPIVLTERGHAVADFAAMLCIIVALVCFVLIGKMLGA